MIAPSRRTTTSEIAVRRIRLRVAGVAAGCDQARSSPTRRKRPAPRSSGRRLLRTFRLQQDLAEIAALARLHRAADRARCVSHFDFEPVVLRAQAVEAEVAE